MILFRSDDTLVLLSFLLVSIAISLFRIVTNLFVVLVFLRSQQF